MAKTQIPKELLKQHRQCLHIDYTPMSHGVETGVMIGGSSHCHNDATPGSLFCSWHQLPKHMAKMCEKRANG